MNEPSKEYPESTVNFKPDTENVGSTKNFAPEQKESSKTDGHVLTIFEMMFFNFFRFSGKDVEFTMSAPEMLERMKDYEIKYAAEKADLFAAGRISQQQVEDSEYTSGYQEAMKIIKENEGKKKKEEENDEEIKQIRKSHFVE